jgi:hypothetical protein
MKLHGSLINMADLTSDQRQRMFELMDRHYQNLGHASFEEDLAEKQWIIEVTDSATGEMCGFSTQMVLEVEVGARTVRALFSGDTIIDRQHWGDQALMHVGGHLALSLADQFPDVELYWFLISQGYKTYRFLPVFFHDFYPRFDRPTPPETQQVIDSLARKKFTHLYQSGVIRAASGQYRLREGVADVTPHRLRDPHVQYFIERNPNHALGDELCCVARLSRANFTDTAHRVLGPAPEAASPCK